MAHYPSVFISDLHLGSPWCQTAELSDMLEDLDCDQLYLVGDILDSWHMGKGRPMPANQLLILHKIMELATRIKVIYLTGNHDSFLRKESYRAIFRQLLPNIHLCNQLVHVAKNQKRYLVVHGDAYDNTMKVPLLERAANWFYSGLRHAWERYPGLFKTLRLDPDKLESRLMGMHEKGSSATGGFEQRILKAVRKRGLDGVICGHTHIAALKHENGIIYANCGYWTGPCHALIEQADGELMLLTYSDHCAPAPQLEDFDQALDNQTK